ncbi:MAG: flagellar hook-length control protein FliK, partial [Shewanella sp.]
MQQMNNILLASSAKNSASSSKVMAQETNSEDFSAALASVVSVSETPTKSNLSKDMPVKSGQPESSVDEEQAEDATDINLIFAQIGMANEMKKAAVTGDALPLEGQLTAIEDAASSLSVLAEGGALPAEEATVATFLDELAKFAEPSKDSHVSVTADAVVMTQSVNQTSTSEADTELASQTRTELGTVQTSLQLSLQASSTTEAELTQSFNALTSTANPDISDKIALSDDAEAL